MLLLSIDLIWRCRLVSNVIYGHSSIHFFGDEALLDNLINVFLLVAEAWLDFEAILSLVSLAV